MFVLSEFMLISNVLVFPNEFEETTIHSVFLNEKLYSCTKNNEYNPYGSHNLSFRQNFSLLRKPSLTELTKYQHRSSTFS